MSFTFCGFPVSVQFPDAVLKVSAESADQFHTLIRLAGEVVADNFIVLYLADFVLFGIEGDFLDALEVITLVENFETVAPESSILESQLLLTEYFGQTEKRDEQKDAILTDLAMLLKDFSEQEGTEDLFLE